MKKLGKLQINPEKLLNKDELVLLKGGSGNCGPGVQEYYCTIVPCEGCGTIEGTACGVILQDILDTIVNTYPDHQYVHCQFVSY